MKINRENYHLGTFGVYVMTPRPRRKADYVSRSGSQYWYTCDGVYRNADHWGEVAFSEWYLKDPKTGRTGDNVGRRKRTTGFCEWDEFKTFSEVKNSRSFAGHVYKTNETKALAKMRAFDKKYCPDAYNQNPY